MKFIKTLLLLAFLLTVTSCADDCVYKTFEDVRGEEQCGKFCPTKDAEGNDLVDENGEVILERTKKVDQINCTINISTISTTSTTSTTLPDN